MKAEATVHICPACGFPAQTRDGVAKHIGHSHRGVNAARNRELVRKFHVGYPVAQISDIHGLPQSYVKSVVWRALQHPRCYEDYHKLSYSDPVAEVPLAHYSPEDWTSGQDRRLTA